MMMKKIKELCSIEYDNNIKALNEYQFNEY